MKPGRSVLGMMDWEAEGFCREQEGAKEASHLSSKTGNDEKLMGIFITHCVIVRVCMILRKALVMTVPAPG